MSFWTCALVAICTAWFVLIASAVIGAGIPVMRDKMRKRKSRRGSR